MGTQHMESNNLTSEVFAWFWDSDPKEGGKNPKSRSNSSAHRCANPWRWQRAQIVEIQKNGHRTLLHVPIQLLLLFQVFVLCFLYLVYLWWHLQIWKSKTDYLIYVLDTESYLLMSFCLSARLSSQPLPFPALLSSLCWWDRPSLPPVYSYHTNLVEFHLTFILLSIQQSSGKALSGLLRFTQKTQEGTKGHYRDDEGGLLWDKWPWGKKPIGYLTCRTNCKGGWDQ